MTITPDNADTLIQALQWLKEDGEIDVKFTTEGCQTVQQLTEVEIAIASTFRRAQKPEECWRVYYGSTRMETVRSLDEAQKLELWAKAKGYLPVRIVHMREVKP